MYESVSLDVTVLSATSFGCPIVETQGLTTDSMFLELSRS